MAESIATQYTYRALFRDLRARIRPYRWRFFGATIARFICDIAWLYPAYALATVIDFLKEYSPGTPLTPVWTLLGLWLLASAVRQGAAYVAKFYGFQVSVRIALDVERDSIEHLARLDIAWHERENAGNKLKRISSGASGMQRIVRMWIASGVEIIVVLIGTLVVLLHFSNLVAGMTIGFLVTYFSIAAFMVRRAAQTEDAENVETENVHGLAFEIVQNIRSIKVMGMTAPLLVRMREAMDVLFVRTRARIFRYQSGFSIFNMWANAYRVFAFAIIIMAIRDGALTLGFLILFNQYFTRFCESTIELVEGAQEFISAKYGIARLKMILDEPIRIDDDHGKVAFPKQWKQIEFRDVSFAYGETQVLDHVSFTITRGEKIGIVGVSGAGKSTIFKLLLKEREEYTGDILVDSTPLAGIRLSDYFSRIAVVLQDTEVFNFSLKENITIADAAHEKNTKRINRAISTAHVDDFLPKLPQGVETKIGEKGIRLSGGEKQRLGIARAVFKEPEILLLDEATSHLDLESEEKIQDSLHNFFETVTAIVIAHRLTTIREMDRILVLEDGRIVESGSFASLIRKRGRFKELWEKQRL